MQPKKSNEADYSSDPDFFSKDPSIGKVAKPVPIKEAVETFTKKYAFKDIWSVGTDEEYGIIHVYTSNAKIWVDLPAKHEGFTVKMNVGRKPRPAALAAATTVSASK